MKKIVSLLRIFKLLIKNKAMLKNLNLKKDWKTTVTGIVMILVMVLGSLGILTPEQGEGIKTGIAAIIDAFGGDIVGTVSVILLALGGIFHLFVPDKKDPE